MNKHILVICLTVLAMYGCSKEEASSPPMTQTSPSVAKEAMQDKTQGQTSAVATETKVASGPVPKREKIEGYKDFKFGMTFDEIQEVNSQLKACERIEAKSGMLIGSKCYEIAGAKWPAAGFKDTELGV